MSARTLMAESRSRSMNINVSRLDEIKTIVNPLTMKQALDTVYNSETYTKVLDLRTGLYSQSTAYVYSILETEILTGKLG